MLSINIHSRVDEVQLPFLPRDAAMPARSWES